MLVKYMSDDGLIMKMWVMILKNYCLFFQLVSLVAFALILNFDNWDIFSRYGFYIIVSGLCWTSLLIILVLHGVGVCAGNVYGKWQREYSLFVFMLSYSLSFMFLFFFGSALLAQWAYDLADGFLIFCVVSNLDVCAA
jgi:hypothetical protein